MKRLPNRLSAIGLTLLATLACPSLHAQSPSTSSEAFPSKPMRWIVPFPPGGPVDMIARIVGQRLSERMRQPVLVENRAGAFGSVGAETAVRATPDGYTV